MRQLLLFCLLIPFLSFSQIQIGADIDGIATNDLFGNSVSLSSDGTIIAIGAPESDGINGVNSGYVQVFHYNGSGWIQLGNDIDGKVAGDFSGYSVSLSSSGNSVAIGATGTSHVRVYNYNGSAWTQVGDDIDGETSTDSFGWSVSLSSDGTTVAIGAIGNDGNGISSGHVSVYSYSEFGGWIQLGNDIDGEAAGDSSGYSVGLSSNGTTVAIGARNNDGVNGIDSGHVRVYNYNELNGWEQFGNDIDGEVGNTGLGFSDSFGFSISLSSDGSVVAIGAPFNDGNNVEDSGHVRVYQNNGSGWTQIDDDIDGEAAGDLSGRSISLSGDGTIIAVGAYRNDDNGIDSGYVRIYQNNGSGWTKIGDDINGEAAGDFLGFRVSLSTDGNRVAATALYDNLDNSGYVRVYDLNTVLSTESFNKDYFAMHPNPVKDVLNINLSEGLELKQVNIYNVLSQYLFSTKELKINTHNLKSGMYFIEIVTNKGKSAKKVVIE